MFRFIPARLSSVVLLSVYGERVAPGSERRQQVGMTRVIALEERASIAMIAARAGL